MEPKAPFKSLLVPLDFTDKNRRAIEVAAALARAGGGRIDFLHVIEKIPGIPFEELKPFYARLESDAGKHLQAAAESLSREGLETYWEIAYGKRVEEILEHAERREHDLIVLSSHAYQPAEAKRSLGNISYQIAILSRCPVLLAR
jgi:nucleotide-binding universal stress UspA family protein